VPLFREIQRVLSSSSGPVNWELARQVGVATAIEAGDPEPSADDQRRFDDAVRLAEIQVAGFTGLDAPSDVPTVEAIRRGPWVQRTIDGLRPIVEPAAMKLGDAISKAQQEALGGMLGDAAAEQGAGLAQVLGQLSPLLLGAQVGQVLGSLAQQVLGQYDVALPRPDGAHALVFVVPNIAEFERDWSLDPTEFRTWVAFHEVTHRFEFARPWVLGHVRSLLEDYLATMRLDVDALRQRLESLDPSNPETMQEMLGSSEGLFGTEMDDEQRLKLGRIEAFMATAEGYGDHVSHALAARLLSTGSRIEEAMLRYREGERVDPVMERMLGIEIERDRYRAGRAFCEVVVEQSDEETLARMWDSPEALPSLPEIDEPRLWLARTV